MSGVHLSVPVSDTDHILGNTNAPVTLLEYGDFQCPYCGSAYPILKRVKERLGPRLRFVFRQFPLGEIHPNAVHAAEASEAAAAQGGPAAFWAMHDLLFERQRRLDDSSLERYAVEAGVPEGVVRDALAAGTYTDVVRKSFSAGVRSGVNGTPTLFIDGIRYDGPRDEETLVAVLELVANEAEPQLHTR
jgi:protein-disulfide isomerase